MKNTGSGHDKESLDRLRKISEIKDLLWDMNLGQLGKVEKAVHEIRYSHKGKKT